MKIVEIIDIIIIITKGSVKSTSGILTVKNRRFN